MGILERGDIVWTNVPIQFQKFGMKTHRPALVLSVFGKRSVGVVFMSSKINDLYVGDVIIPANEETGLDRPAKAKCYTLSMINQHLIERKIGRLPAAMMPIIEENVEKRYPKPDL